MDEHLTGKRWKKIRLMAVERVREGESAANVIDAYGFNRTTIYKWLNAALRPGLGIKALRSTKATGRPRTLTPRQEAKCFDGSTAEIRGSTVWTSAVDACDRRRTDREEIRHETGADGGWRIVGQSGADAAKTFATSLSA